MSTAPPTLNDTKGHAVPPPPASLTDEEKSDAGTLEGASESDLHARWYEPPDAYESKHRWDPRATWTPEEEKKLVRKLDVRVAAVACLCFAALQLDRGNITNALSDNMLKDLHLTTGDYNTGMTIFYVCFLAAELPSQMISKKLGSDVWIPIQMMAWSAVAMGQAGLSGKASFYVTRGLMGLIEGGFIADTILYLSYYYTHAELTTRLSFFWVSYMGTNIIGAFLAAAILEVRKRGHEGWRYLFGIEGAITFIIGAWACWYLPAGPTQTGSRWRQAWLNEREETIVVNRVLRDDPTKSSMHNREGLSLKELWLSITDYDLWPLYALGLLFFIAPGTVGAYFTLTLRSLKFSTFQTNMLIIPSQVLFCIGNLTLAFLVRRYKERLATASLAAWWLLIWFIVLVCLPDHSSKWLKWAILTLIVGYPYPHPILVSMNSSNAGSVRTRTVASSLYNMFVQASSLVASNVYQPSDAPYYHKGNRALIGIIAATIVLFYLSKGWYIWRNHQRDKIWNSWTNEQKDEYIRTTKDKGNKRLDFRFLH
ncbi:putative transporter [Vanrija pseudolonga]|uniref:Purtative transporter n=1 Tax=Vanrija pseudolonga TaxID=143232 RepID=A0AAF0YBQ5_9TREE|nr:purtative transporter [Vanrija pseudolonga]